MVAIMLGARLVIVLCYLMTLTMRSVTLNRLDIFKYNRVELGSNRVMIGIVLIFWKVLIILNLSRYGKVRLTIRC